MGFYLQKAQAVLDEVKTKRTSKGESELELDNGLVFRMKLEDQGAHDAAEFFYPGYSVVEDRIADLEGKHPGLKTTVSLAPPAMTFVVYDAKGATKVFQLQGANIKGSVSFSVNNKGEGTMKLTVHAKLSDDEWASLKDYVGSDVKVSAMDMQPDMFGNTSSDGQSDLEEAVHGITKEILKQEREARGWTREEMAGKMGMSSKTIGRYERGERIIPAEAAEKAEALFDSEPVAPEIIFDDEAAGQDEATA